MAFVYSPKIITNGLVLALDAADQNSYPGSGTTWTDLSGGNNNGSLVNGPTFNSLNGGSILFDGVNDYASSTNVTNSLTTAQKEGSLTYEYWLRPTDTISTGFVEQNTYTNWYQPANPTKQGLSGDVTYLYGSTNSIYVGFGFHFGTNGCIIGVHKNAYAPTILVDYQSYNSICHLVVIKRTLNCSYYVNGQLKKNSLNVASGATTIGDTMAWITQSTNPFMKYFKGNVYSVKFYNRELTATEITQNYNATKSRYGL